MDSLGSQAQGGGDLFGAAGAAGVNTKQHAQAD